MGAPGRKRTCGCAIPSVTLAGFLSVFASALVLSLLAEAALRGLGVTMPSPVHGRKWKPAALVEHGSGVTPSGSSLVRAGPRQVLANTDRHGLTFPIVEKGLPVSGNGTSWRLESRGNVTVDEGILDGRVQVILRSNHFAISLWRDVPFFFFHYLFFFFSLGCCRRVFHEAWQAN